MVDMNFLVTDSDYRRSGVDYIYKGLKRQVAAAGGTQRLGEDGGRRYYAFDVADSYAKRLKDTLEDRIADVIAVNYKYDYFKKRIKVAGLKSVEYELLLSALISADIDEDKRYVIARICGSPYSIDGSFNFTMKPLVDKWNEIVGYIPPYFTAEQLKEFVSFIVSEKKGGRVYVAGGSVYDVDYNLLTRADLAGDGDCRLIREIILSSSAEVELSSPVEGKDEFYLKEFFGDKIFFGKGYFC